MALNITSIDNNAAVSEPATEGKAGTSAAAKRQAMGDTGKASKAVEPNANAGEPVEVTAETYQIDDIPMPDFTRKPFSKVSKYPWARLEKGKSFFVPGGKKGSWSTACAKHKKDSEGKKDFKCKEWTENDVAGIRVWRVL